MFIYQRVRCGFHAELHMRFAEKPRGADTRYHLHGFPGNLDFFRVEKYAFFCPWTTEKWWEMSRVMALEKWAIGHEKWKLKVNPMVMNTDS